MFGYETFALRPILDGHAKDVALLVRNSNPFPRFSCARTPNFSSLNMDRLFHGASHEVFISPWSAPVSLLTSHPLLTSIYKGPAQAPPILTKHSTQPKPKPSVQSQYAASYRPGVPSESEMPDEWGYPPSSTAQVSSVTSSFM